MSLWQSFFAKHFLSNAGIWETYYDNGIGMNANTVALTYKRNAKKWEAK